jgi:tetratricopeptide (TPR) repeat protein
MKNYLILLIFFIVWHSNNFAQENKLYQKGVAFLTRAEFESAEKILDSAIIVNPSDSKLYLNRGIANFKQIKYSDAENDFQMAGGLGCNVAYLWLAKIYAEQNNPKSSLNYLNKYLESDIVPNPYKIFKDNSFKKIYQTNEWQDFISNFQPSEIQSAIIFAEQYLSKLDYKSASKLIESALMVNPESALLHEANAEIYEKEGNFALARLEIKKALDFDPENSNYLCKNAKYCYLQNDYSLAFTYYQKAIELSPEKFELFLDLSRTCLQLNKPDVTKNLSTEYLSYFPGDTSAVFLVARANFDLKQYNEVLKSMNLLINGNRPLAGWFRLRGMTYFETATYKYASYDLSMSLDLEPNNIDANFYLGMAENEIGNKELACYYWQRALKLGDSRAFDKIEKNCGTQ